VDGILVDPRNRMSLSAFQALLWTLLLVSGYASAAFVNIRLGQADPLQINIPQQLLLLAGLSATTLSGSPFILSRRAGGSKDTTDPNAPSPNALARNPTPRDASWADLLTGERASNVGVVDLSRVQLFLFTIAAVLAYGAAVAQVFNAVPGTATLINTLPAFDAGVLGLLTISHAGYLVSKASQGQKRIA
jgi:hypothetical protein